MRVSTGVAQPVVVTDRHFGSREGAGLLATIEHERPLLSPAQSRVATYLLEHYQTASDHTITDLAEAAGVSTGTVQQLARRFGLKGYQELRLALARDAVLHTDAGNWSATNTDGLGHESSTDSAIRRVFGTNVTALTETARAIDRPVIEAVVETLSSARRIECVGAGTAGLLASELALKLRKLGLDAHSDADAHLQAMSASTLAPVDVLVAVSHSGRTIDTIRCAEIARERGARVIALTGPGKSLLASRADLVLETVSADRGFHVEPMASAVAELSMIQLLFVMLVEQEPEARLANLSRTQRATDDRHVRGRV